MFDSVVHTYLPPYAALVALAYFVVCVFLNTTLTSLICYRLIRHGKLVRAQLGQEHSSLYFSVAEIIIQSMLPYTLSGIAFLVALGVRTRILTAFAWVYFMMMVGNWP